MTETGLDILMVEDSESDAALAFEAMSRGKLANKVIHVKNGEEALRFLFQTDEYQHASRPGLVLLDLNMAGTDGWEVLKQLRSNQSTKNIPVIVMISSSHDAETHTSNGLQADGYMIKPVTMKSICEVAQAIKSFHIEIIETPVY